MNAINEELAAKIAIANKGIADLDDYIGRTATVDSGISNSKGDEPGARLNQNTEWACNSRLSFLHTKLPQEQRWYDISEAAYTSAVAVKDAEKEQGERNGPQSEFSNADNALYAAVRYLEISGCTYLPMLAESNRLKALFAEVTGREWVYNPIKKGTSNVSVDPAKMAAIMAERQSVLLGPDKKPKVAAA